MLFKNYLERVIGSKVKVGIVRALLRFPGKGFTARELAGFVHVSHTPVLKSLKDLKGMNLVEIEQYGTSKLIKLNKNSYLYGPLNYLFRFESDTKERLIAKIRNILPKVQMVLLFGSIQQGKEKMNSDIDLLIVTKNKRKTENAIKEKQDLIMREFGNTMSPTILTMKQFINKKNKPFAKDLRKNYKILKGKDLVKKYWK
ncbi:MAG: nucleotidyltransferase domain-containing protein [Nanoarchaeota archaeon]